MGMGKAVVPDLPNVRLDVPDVVDSRFARLRTSLRTRRSTGTPDAIVVAVLAAALAWSIAAPSATAEDLTDRRAQVEQQIAKTQGDLSESSHALSAAGVAVDQAQGNLEVAQDELARTQQQLTAARVKDRALGAKLKRAQAELAAAKKAVIAGQAKLDAKKSVAGDVIRDQYQHQTNLLPIAILMQDSSTADLQTRLQWSTTMFDTTQAGIDELALIQRKLSVEKAKQARLETEVAADRKQAAADLVDKRTLEARAETQTANVAQLLSRRQAVETAAAQTVAQDKAQYVQLTRERASVEQRIAARVAKAKAERAAAARRAAATAARAARAAEAAQAAARRAAAAASKQRSARAAESNRVSPRSTRPPTSKSTRSPNRKPTSRPEAQAASSTASSSAHHGFDYPVAATITSAYGMRYHPVLKYWKLHDGTDFGAGCGTAIRAPQSGRVAERYDSSAYGNRLMIDHGDVDGTYVTTGYNHAISYTVGVGESVSKGQVIGYVGTTGLSTGCHLHLMVWLDGNVSNPMAWY